MKDKQENQALLMAYINGTATAAQRKEVEQMAAIDPDIRSELIYLRQLRESVRQQDAQDGPVEIAWQRFRHMLDAEISGSRHAAGKKWTVSKAVAAAAVIVILVQGGVIWNLENPGYMPLSGEQAESGLVLQVRFAPTATESQLRDVLKSVNAEIISGPSSAGIYRVRVLDVPNDDVTASAMVSRLSAMTDVVVYAGQD